MYQKERKERKQKKTKETHKEGLGPSEVTLQKNKKTKKKRNKEKIMKKKKETAKIPKNSFSVISQHFPFSWWLFKISLL